MRLSGPRWYIGLRKSLMAKLLLSVGVVVFLSLSVWGFFNIRYLGEKSVRDLTVNMDRLGNTIRLGTHYAMMLNSREDIQQIISNIARQNDIASIRIYNKMGKIKFSNRPDELEQRTDIKNEACFICHHTSPPPTQIELTQRVRFIDTDQGYRLVGIISPIYNEAGCADASCHVHPKDKHVLGALDLVVSLKETDRSISDHEKNLIWLGALLLSGAAVMIIIITRRFVSTPIRRLTQEARHIENGRPPTKIELHQQDEIQDLADAINEMGYAIDEKTQALNRQRDEYQNLFATVPCIITVQNRDYRLISYNREFANAFNPRPDAYCFEAYKGRDSKCENCPVEKTFADGQPHFSEESAPDKDGNVRHWIVRTSPVKDASGRIVAAMEMNLDITERKHLEEKLRESEKKYCAIFNTIPNPVFVLSLDDLSILDCNDSVQSVYAWERDELIGRPFGDLFEEKPDERMQADMKSATSDMKAGMIFDRVKHRTRQGHIRYVSIRLSASEFGGQQVLLATVNDITQRLETEQQLIQASKMATLGEMATGVAHELNQPLSVIKTASSFFMRKLRKDQAIEATIMQTMAEEIDRHVQRASKIIGHMRQFGRKADPDLAKVQLNDIITQALELFSQQLKVRGIDIQVNPAPDLPMVMGDPDRLEQVVINLLINARDAIEERHTSDRYAPDAVKEIRLATTLKDHVIELSVCDTGIGIDPQIAERIFEPFFTTKKVGQGTGLGLSISYGIIKECGGRIYARPGMDGGTCFIIEFPNTDKKE